METTTVSPYTYKSWLEAEGNRRIDYLIPKGQAVGAPPEPGVIRNWKLLYSEKVGKIAESKGETSENAFPSSSFSNCLTVVTLFIYLHEPQFPSVHIGDRTTILLVCSQE